MARRTLSACAVLLVLASVVGGPQSRTLAQSSFDHVLIVRPYFVHPGDTIDIGGAGYERRTREVFVAGCPSPEDAQNGPQPFLSPLRYRSKLESGWVTDDQGKFAGWTIRIPAILVNPAKPYVQCTIYAKYGTNWLGSTIPGTFFILPASRPLDRCSRHICLTVTPSPARVHSGNQVRLAMTGWPGAQVVVQSRNDPTAPRKTLRLDWAGHGSVLWPARMPLPTAVASLKLNLQVHATFEEHTGTQTAHVLVVR